MTVSIEAELLLKNFPIVCVGGSAGGLDAYIRLLLRTASRIGTVCSKDRDKRLTNRIPIRS